MLTGAAHIHFLEGERGPEEATLSFDHAVDYLAQQGVRNLIATFHLRHPTDLRPATPQRLLSLIADYDGPINIQLMPEANMLFTPQEDGRLAGHDIWSWKKLPVNNSTIMPLVTGWILSAHFTVALGCTKTRDEEFAPEQSAEFLLRAYQQVMQDDWIGWIGHPFQWSVGRDLPATFEQLMITAAQTGRVIELPIRPFRRKPLTSMQQARKTIPQFQPEIIARFSEHAKVTNQPTVAISLDAHHFDDLKYGWDNASRLAEWLVAEGVLPKQIWAYNADG